MSHDPVLRICCEAPLLKSAVEGEHNFINLLKETAENALFRVEFGLNTDAKAMSPLSDNTFVLSHMKQPQHPRGLIFRRAYHYPFWQIDQTAVRWNWDVAHTVFDPKDAPASEAKKFAGFWRRRLFGDPAKDTRREGMIFVPLQGRLREHRSFQTCSPIRMLELTLQHSAGRKVIATLHPKEHYSAADHAALEGLQRSYSHLTVATGNMEHHLQCCDFVVTQNSSAAFAGYFFGKPALLFAGIDFHHIAVRADLDQIEDCFAEVVRSDPAYDAYLWWFWQSQAINAGRPDAMEKIAARFRRFGWPI